MKTFESEFAELANWIRMKNKEDSEAIKKDTTSGRDGELVYQRAQVVKEYNKRLLALKKKYGKDTDSAGAITQESNLTKAKKVHA